MKHELGRYCAFILLLTPLACKPATTPVIPPEIDTREDQSVTAQDVPSVQDTLADLASESQDGDALKSELPTVLDIAADVPAATTTCTLPPDLPVPGAKCDNIGEMSCTNVGSKDWKPNAFATCLRPNAVLCEVQATGDSAWVLHSAEELGGAGACKGGIWKCGIVENESRIGKMTAAGLCESNQQGEAFCSGADVGMGTVWTCKFPSDADLAYAKAKTECYPAMQELPQWIPTPCTEFFYCKSGDTGFGTKGIAQRCVESPTAPPHCAKTCEEMGEKTPPK